MTKTNPLTQKKCRPCEGAERPFGREAAEEHLLHTPGWRIDDDARGLSREYNTKNFLAAVDFIRKAAQVAEAEGHHPDIHLTGYRKLKINLSTHAIGGLSENDFILAAKLNELPIELKETK